MNTHETGHGFDDGNPFLVRSGSSFCNPVRYPWVPFWITDRIEISKTRASGKTILSLYEFRTLYDKGETSSKLSHNSNIIEKLVSFLRRSKLYKLPQLLNVLYGQMSFVGPPLRTREYLVSCDIEQVRRFHVKPGITGWAQIHNSIGLSKTEKDRLDVWYVDNKSLRLDLYILWVTIKKSINLKIMGNLGISWYKKLQEYAGKVSGDRNVGVRQSYRK